jgi:hypothetical protein
MQYKILSLLPLLLLSACASTMTPLNQGAEKITTGSKHPARACKQLDDVQVKEGGKYLKAIHKQTGAMNQMKNEALALGGNYVQIKEDYSKTIDGRYDPASVVSVVIDGIVYRCPKTLIPTERKKSPLLH